jgi:chemotaxis protein methyltransferase CheR
MLLAELGPRLADWKIEILGVDLDTKILKRAADAVYTQFEVQRGLPVQMLMKYFEHTDHAWKLKPVIRDRVKFRTCNLLDSFADLGRFDVIFCRNVLIYFDLPTKRDVLDRLAAQLEDDGYLFLGGAETVLDITDRFDACPDERGIYMPQLEKKPVKVAS